MFVSPLTIVQPRKFTRKVRTDHAEVGYCIGLFIELFIIIYLFKQLQYNAIS